MLRSVGWLCALIAACGRLHYLERPDPRDDAGPQRDAAIPSDAFAWFDTGRTPDGGLAPLDAAFDAGRPPPWDASNDAGVTIDGAMCGAVFDSVSIVCEPTAIRLELSARFPGCGCTRAYATAIDSGGRRWTQSDEMLGPDGLVVFDSVDTFRLGGASISSSFAVDLCCDRSTGGTICFTEMDVARIPCP